MTDAWQVAALEAPSPALGRPLPFHAVIPTGSGHAPLPVVTLLHGSGGDATEFLALGLVETLRALWGAGAQPALFIMPSTGPTWYVDRAEAMETAVVRDLAAHVEARFDVRRGPGSRAIGGLSMGGYGALRFALRDPAAFTGLLLLAPAVMDVPGPRSVARNGTFGDPFDEEAWAAAHPRRLLGRLREPGVRLPAFFGIGDRDFLLGPSVRLHEDWLAHGQDSRLRVGPGEHDLDAVRPFLRDGLALLLGTLAPDRR